MKIFLTVAALVVLAHAVSAAEPIRVFVFTAPPTAGLIDQDSKRRADSVKDLETALVARKQLTLAGAETEADVLVEIVSSQVEATGGTSAITSHLPGWPLMATSTTADHRPTVRIRLRVPRLDYSTEMVSAVGALAGWRVQAEELTRQIAKWAKDNAAQLQALRSAR